MFPFTGCCPEGQALSSKFSFGCELASQPERSTVVVASATSDADEMRCTIESSGELVEQWDARRTPARRRLTSDDSADAQSCADGRIPARVLLTALRRGACLEHLLNQ